MLVMVVVDVVVVVVGESPGVEKNNTYVPAITKNPMIKAATLRDSHRGSNEFQKLKFTKRIRLHQLPKTYFEVGDLFLSFEKKCLQLDSGGSISRMSSASTCRSGTGCDLRNGKKQNKQTFVRHHLCSKF